MNRFGGKIESDVKHNKFFKKIILIILFIFSFNIIFVKSSVTLFTVILFSPCHTTRPSKQQQTTGNIEP